VPRFRYVPVQSSRDRPAHETLRSLFAGRPDDAVKCLAVEREPTLELTELKTWLNLCAFACTKCCLFRGPEDQITVTSSLNVDEMNK
jgi:hypothetical protein